jgi:hypothetical protein
MMVIDCGDLVTPDDQLKGRRGKPSHLYAYLNVETRLRDFARRISKGEAKSAYAEFKDDPSGRYLEKRWCKLKPTLMKGVELTLALEQPAGTRTEAEGAWDSNWQFIIELLKAGRDRDSTPAIASFDPNCHKDAPVGTLAWVNTGHPFYDKAGRAGWFPVAGLGHGEVLMRRDMYIGFFSAKVPNAT